MCDDNKLAVLLLVFNRPKEVDVLCRALSTFYPSAKIYVACDGPRIGNEADRESIDEVFSTIKKYFSLNENQVLLRKQNLGCKMAIEGALDWFFENEQAGIILEDDCIPNATFFNFCNLLISKYDNQDGMGLVAGTSYYSENRNVFGYNISHVTSIWGWATWGKVWKKYRAHGEIKEGVSERAFVSILKDKKLSLIYWEYYKKYIDYNLNTWDIPFVTFLVLNDFLSIMPTHNLVQNIGIQGTHSVGKGKYHNREMYDFDIVEAMQNVSTDILKNNKEIGHFLCENYYLLKVKFLLRRLICYIFKIDPKKQLTLKSMLRFSK